MYGKRIDKENNKNSAAKQHVAIKDRRWWAAIVFVLGLAALLGYWLTASVHISEVTFSNVKFDDTEELKAALPAFDQTHVDSIDYLALIELVEQRPYVKRADINVESRGVLRFNITERQPIALLVDGKSRSYVDGEGIKLPVTKPLDLPVVYGFNAGKREDTLTSNHYNMVRDFLDEISKQSFLSATISEITVNDESGLVALSHENGVKLVFGYHDFQKKLQNWKAFYEQIIPKQGINAFRSIDFRFEGQVVTKPAIGT